MTTAPDQTEAQSKLLSSTLCLEMSFSKLGVKRSASTAKIQVDADKDMLHLSKDIISSPEIKDISTGDTAFKKKLRNYSIPTRMFREGIYPLPISLVPTVDQEVQDFIATRKAKVDAFLKRGEPTEENPEGTPSPYELRIEEARGRLVDGVLFDASDYPSAETVRTKFNVEAQYTNWGVPRALESISQAIFERESTKSKNKLMEAQEEIRAALRVGTKQLLDHLKERLAPTEEGKNKKFHYTAVEKINAWIATFDARNLTNDDELAEVVAQAREILASATPGAIRENGTMREYITAGISQVTEALDKLVVTDTGNVRSFLDDEEEAA